MEEESKQKTKKQMKEEKIAREHARDTDIKASRFAREEWELQRLRGRLLRFWASFLSLQKAALGTTGCAK